MDPIFYIEKAVQLRYMIACHGARVFISRIDKLSDSKDIGIVLKKGMASHGWVPVNLHQINDARELDYSLLALEQALEPLLIANEVDGEALSLADEKTLNDFTTRLSVARSVCDDEGVRAVVTAVVEVIRAARSPRVQGDDAVAEADRGRVVTAVRGVTRAVVTAVRGVVRAARSSRVEGNDSMAAGSPLVDGNRSVADLARAAHSSRVEGNDSMAAGSPLVDGNGSVADLARAARSSRVEGNESMDARLPPVDGNRSLADLARAALGEVRAARARPVTLYNDLNPLHISSVQGAEEVLRAAPPHTPRVWNTARELVVRGVVPLSDAGELYYQLERCSQRGWRVRQMKKLGQVRGLDSHLILLTYRLKCLFKRSSVLEDGAMDGLLLESIGMQTEELLRFCTEDLKMFQSEIGTIPDTILEMVHNPSDVVMVRENANRAITILRRIRSQQVMF